MEPYSDSIPVKSDTGPVQPGEAAATAPAASGEAPAAPLEEALAAKALEVERLQDRLLRLQAEFENYKRRTAREKAEFVKFANEGLLLNVLPVLDSLERARASAPADPAMLPFLDGVDMIIRLFRMSLEKVGVTPVEALGQPFDPDLHQAVAQVERPDGEDHQVVEVVQRGYLLEGRVLRPAMVKVSRKLAGVDPAGEGEPA
ncbi:MAG: nucleotide exchange factor GrpE [candidate division NC10 bacterium]|nr:nucleotide exchange factor GrpE [candidate division NC10 bacterium]